jgi:hypothetical protein
MEPLLEVLPGRRLGLVPQKARTDDGCRRQESHADQGNGGCPSHSGWFGRGSRRLYLTRRGCRLPPPSAPAARLRSMPIRLAVETSGLEPPTPCLQSRCSTN